MTAEIEGALAALQRAAHHARTYLTTLDVRSVASTVSPAVLRERLGGPLPERESDPVEVVDRLVAATDGGHLGSAGGRLPGNRHIEAKPDQPTSDLLLGMADVMGAEVEHIGIAEGRLNLA